MEATYCATLRARLTSWPTELSAQSPVVATLGSSTGLAAITLAGLLVQLRKMYGVDLLAQPAASISDGLLPTIAAGGPSLDARWIELNAALRPVIGHGAGTLDVQGLERFATRIPTGGLTPAQLPVLEAHVDRLPVPGVQLQMLSGVLRQFEEKSAATPAEVSAALSQLVAMPGGHYEALFPNQLPGPESAIAMVGARRLQAALSVARAAGVNHDDAAWPDALAQQLTQWGSVSVPAPWRDIRVEQLEALCGRVAATTSPAVAMGLPPQSPPQLVWQTVSQRFEGPEWKALAASIANLPEARVAQTLQVAETLRSNLAAQYTVTRALGGGGSAVQLTSLQHALTTPSLHAAISGEGTTQLISTLRAAAALRLLGHIHAKMRDAGTAKGDAKH